MIMKFPAIKGLLLGKRASPRAFEEKWVDPLYMGVPGYGKGEQNDFWCAVDRVYSEVSEQLVGELLDRNDWRSRKVGGFFAGLRVYSSILPRIEALLVESKFCYSGIGYCFALVRFSSAESSAALRRYLDVWLPRRDCCYDQMVALGSLVVGNPVSRTERITCVTIAKSIPCSPRYTRAI